MHTLEKLKVLLVEDNPVTLEALTAYLRDKGHEVITSGNGLGALVSLEAFHPDVVVCDHVMPALDGLAVLKHVREDPKLNDLPVVLITALADGPELDGLVNAMTRSSPVRLLRKPFDPPSLLHAIRSMPRQGSQAQQKGVPAGGAKS